jgi:orotidine-5'-phosphate decarboxylase
MTFPERLNAAWDAHGSLLCVGLDPVVERLPAAIARSSHAILDFNKAIVDATHDLVCAYKPQFACYGSAAAEDQLLATIEHIRGVAPDALVILDAKRGDIGNTAAMYAAEAFERYGADAVTVNPYMGGDTLKPFLDRADRGVVVLCRTSNPGAAQLQGLPVDGRPLYLHVAELAAREWNANGNVMLVVGATAPDELAEVRALCPGIPFLVPGVGAQGGDVEQVISKGARADGLGLVINSSRGIIYAGGGKDFAQKARDAAQELKDTINRYR